VEYVISNNMPVLFEEYVMETVKATGFIGLHGAKGGIDFTFSHRLGEGVFPYVINGWVVSFMKGATMVRLGARKKVLEEFLGFFLEGCTVRGAIAIWKLKFLNSIFLPSYNGL